jgi:hypothetical protein
MLMGSRRALEGTSNVLMRLCGIVISPFVLARALEMGGDE